MAVTSAAALTLPAGAQAGTAATGAVYGGGYRGGYGGWHGGYGGWHGGYGWRGGWGCCGWGWGWGGLGLGLYFATLPLYYQTYWWDGVPYYYADNTYYTYDPNAKQYKTVAPPDGLEQQVGAAGGAPAAGTGSGELMAYPKNGQSADQQAQGQVRVPPVGGGSDGLRSDDGRRGTGGQAPRLHARPGGLPGRPRLQRGVIGKAARRCLVLDDCAALEAAQSS